MATATLERESVMKNKSTITELFKNMVPITDLNKGKGSKIIDDVKKTGYKIVLKNNRPEAVIITPEQFEEMLTLKEEINDMTIGMEALRRMAKFNSKDAISHEDILQEFGISEDELDSVDVEID